MFSLAVTGAGSQAIQALLAVPGASRTLVEATVPYHDQAIRDFLHARDPQPCRSETARALALVAWLRATRQTGQPAFGIGCTAAIATDRDRKGSDRCHLSLQSATSTQTVHIELSKTLSRAEQETICSEAIISLMADALDLQKFSIPETGIVNCTTETAEARPGWQSLLSGHTRRTGTADVAAVFPGAFNPLHEGHRAMLDVAEQELGIRPSPEVSVWNVDKPPLDYLSMQLRQKSTGEDEVIFTHAPTFAEKAAIFPGATFVVGIDTLTRIAEPRYYDDESARDEAINTIAGNGCRFLVFGRQIDGSFLTLDQVKLPKALTSLCTGVNESSFRSDISSTELRAQS